MTIKIPFSPPDPLWAESNSGGIVALELYRRHKARSFVCFSNPRRVGSGENLWCWIVSVLWVHDVYWFFVLMMHFLELSWRFRLVTKSDEKTILKADIALERSASTEIIIGTVFFRLCGHWGHSRPCPNCFNFSLGQVVLEMIFSEKHVAWILSAIKRSWRV